MLTLVTELSPLRQIVGSLVKNVHLTIGTVGSHDFLLDGLTDPDLLHQIVESRQLLLPLLRRYDFNDTGFHPIGIDLLHLFT
jgi:hypothetical protein